MQGLEILFNIGLRSQRLRRARVVTNDASSLNYVSIIAGLDIHPLKSIVTFHQKCWYKKHFNLAMVKLKAKVYFASTIIN